MLNAEKEKELNKELNVVAAKYRTTGLLLRQISDVVLDNNTDMSDEDRIDFMRENAALIYERLDAMRSMLERMTEKES